MTEYFSSKKPQVRRVNKESVRSVLLRTLAEARTFFDAQLATKTDWPEEQVVTSQANLPNPF